MPKPSYRELMAEARAELDAFIVNRSRFGRRPWGDSAVNPRDVRCSVRDEPSGPECGRKPHCRGLCKRHYNRWLKKRHDAG